MTMGTAAIIMMMVMMIIDGLIIASAGMLGGFPLNSAYENPTTEKISDTVGMRVDLLGFLQEICLNF